MSDLPNIVYGAHTVATSTLPAKSLEALLRRGVTHYLGNEQASKVTSKIETALALADGTTAEARKAAIKAFRESHGEQVTAWTNDAIVAALAALSEGTIGNRAVGTASGPKLAPLDTIIRRTAKAEVIDTLKANGLSTPKGDEKVVFDGGKEFTMDELIDRRIAKHGDRLKKAGEKELADRARKAKQAAEAGVGDLID